MNYTYLLECSDGTLYCGWTNDLEKRVKAHNSGRGAKYTKSRRPVRLVWYETFETKEEAMSREVKVKQLSRKQKGSSNRNKQRIQVALVHEKITNQRNDFLQKQSTMLVRENQTICIEDLHIKGMLRNHKLARSISSVSWASFFPCLNIKLPGTGMKSSKCLPCIQAVRHAHVVDIKIHL